MGAIRQGVQREDQHGLLAPLPRDGLNGKTVTVTGAFPLPASGQLPLITPADHDGGAVAMAEPIQHDIILRLDDVSKVYSGIVAVKRANLELRRGAVNVLVGENGAGKSTLMKIIAGVERPTLGRIILDGEDRSSSTARPTRRHGIGMIFQELNLFSNISVAENIFATREITRGIRGIDHKAQVEKANAFLDRLDAGISAETMVEDLPIGQQQLVEIAKAMSLNARILIMDEPTSALSAAEVEILFKVIAELKARASPSSTSRTGWKS
jgi:erythritol transport system ATP-binding protein